MKCDEQRKKFIRKNRQRKQLEKKGTQHVKSKVDTRIIGRSKPRKNEIEAYFCMLNQIFNE